MVHLFIRALALNNALVVFRKNRYRQSVSFFYPKAELRTMLSGFSRSFVILIIVSAGLLMVPAMAGGYVNVPQGGTVFLGEQGLNVAAALGNDTSIGWWASGAAIATSSPDSLVQITSPSSFYVSPTQFGSNTGTWYRIDALGKPDGLAFYIVDPSLDIRVEDTTVNVDVTSNKWVPRGDQVSFRIDSNLYPIFQRGSSSSEGIAIKVQAPDGGQYSALIDSSGTTHSLENLAVSTSTYETGSIWDTGNSVYPAGTYTIWAECNVNSMKDNYGVTGKTTSSQISMLDQEQNPLISVNVPTTSDSATTRSTTTATTKPVTTLTTLPAKTSVATTIPQVNTTTVPVVSTSTAPISTETTSAPAPGFGVIVSLISLGAVSFLILKRQD